MKYAQFLAILSDQYYRFAPDEEAPESLEQMLSHLRSATTSAEADPQLLEILKGTLAPIYRGALVDAHETATEAVAARLVERAKEEAASMKASEEAQVAKRVLEQEDFVGKQSK